MRLSTLISRKKSFIKKDSFDLFALLSPKAQVQYLNWLAEPERND